MRTICLHWEQVCNYIDNDPFQEEWYEYCRKNHCEICKENGINCSTCEDYETGFHVAENCVHFHNCIYNIANKCTDKVAKECVGYREE